jgi:sulfite exporter TauE/SafE/plastocyanin domain-containing protein/copper chaperone CopZ
MSKEKIIISIKGMHCRSCEILVQQNLEEIPEVEKSNVDFKKGVAEIVYGTQKPNMREVENAIRQAGYSIGSEEKKSWLSKNPQDYKDLGIAFLFLVGIFVVLNNLGLTNISFGSASNPSSLGVVFLVGITAGISTCMALVGGLILGISARHAEKHPQASTMQKFRPHLFFNLGRIGGYALLGGILGMIGSAFQFSGSVLGAMTIIVGVVMLMLGMKLVGIFPCLENGGFTLPKSVSKFFRMKPARLPGQGPGNHEKEYSHRGSMITGALTFFLPCGFTQAMQIYAVSTGSFSRGVLIMGVFALGTAPGLLGIGGLTSVVKGIFAKRFYKFAGVLVIAFALFNISNGYNLTGWQVFAKSTNQEIGNKQAKDSNVTLENGVQIVRMTQTSSGYSPSKFTIAKNVPVRWIITSKNPNSCSASILMNKYGIKKFLTAGENVIEFTPTESGNLPFSCSMGMYTGSFSVTDGGNSVSNVSVDSNSSSGATSSGTCGVNASGGSAAGGCGGSGGGCGGGSNGGGGCGGSGKPVVPTQGAVQNSLVATNSNEQIINATYTYSNDIAPNTFKVKVGQPVKFIIDVKEDGSGCMSTVMIQGLYNKPQVLTKGTKIEMNFTPDKKGVYNITCAMGVPRGTITVE